jgi:AraC-like DNA-binding protein
MIKSNAQFWREADRADCCISEVAAFRVCNRTIHKFSTPDAGRTDYALTYVIEGSWKYTTDTGTFECMHGDMSFLPRGSVYTHVNTPMSRMFVVYFTLRTPDGTYYEPSIHSAEKIICRDPSRYERMFSDIIDRYFNVMRSQSEVKAALYRLVGALTREEALSQLDEDEFARIYPAIEYLTSGNFAGEAYRGLTVSKLAKMCDLSEYTFRELFKKYTGTTPKAYIDEHRIAQVEALLAVNDITITDAAAACGFDDPSYFFKMYRRIRGGTPGGRKFNVNNVKGTLPS